MTLLTDVPQLGENALLENCVLNGSRMNSLLAHNAFLCSGLRVDLACFRLSDSWIIGSMLSGSVSYHTGTARPHFPQDPQFPQFPGRRRASSTSRSGSR